MTDWIVVHEGVLRATAFVSTFVLVAISETLLEARPLRSARWWDRLFRTYRASPAADLPAIGMPEHQATLDQTVTWMLLLPFRWKYARRPSPIHSRPEAA